MENTVDRMYITIFYLCGKIGLGALFTGAEAEKFGKTILPPLFNFVSMFFSFCLLLKMALPVQVYFSHNLRH